MHLLLLYYFYLVSPVIFYEERLYVIQTRTKVRAVSPDNAYAFLTPACGSTVRLTVFCLNQRGLPVEGLTVSVANSLDYTIDTIKAVTNELGQATFDLKSDKEGVFVIPYITCGDIEIVDNLKVCFARE